MSKVAPSDHDASADSKRQQTSVKLAADDDPDIEYEVESTIWDAAMLLFLRFQDGGAPGVLWDKIIMTVAIVLNLFMQLALVVVIWKNLLNNPYEDAKLQTMLEWRALTGHKFSSMDEMTGLTQMHNLCTKKNLWSFEQSEYGVLDDYLNKEIPGVLLSVVALILWVLTTFVEYRRVVQQVKAVCHLPTVRNNEGSVHWVEDDKLEIQGIHYSSRIFLLTTVTLPRFIVMALLCAAGCAYISVTPGLPDLILNAVALAFVLEVDELLYEVLLTQRMQRLVGSTEPINCSKRISILGGLPLEDLLRFFLIAATLLGAICGLLLPFTRSIAAAEQALCGGQVDFTWQQPTIGFKPDDLVTIIRNDPPVVSCGSEEYDAFLAKTYGFDHSTKKSRTQTATEEKQKRLKLVLSYAFQGGTAERSQAVSEKTQKALGSLKVGASDPPIPECPSFDGTVESCLIKIGKVPFAAGACTMSLEAVTCEAGQLRHGATPLYDACPNEEGNMHDMEVASEWWSMYNNATTPFQQDCGESLCECVQAAGGNMSAWLGEGGQCEPLRRRLSSNAAFRAVRDTTPESHGATAAEEHHGNDRTGDTVSMDDSDARPVGTDAGASDARLVALEEALTSMHAVLASQAAALTSQRAEIVSLRAEVAALKRIASGK